MKKYRFAVLLLIAAMLFCGCGAKSEASAPQAHRNSAMYDKSWDSGYYPDVPAAEAPAESSKGSSASSDSSLGAAPVLSERKLIKNGSFSMETLEYEKTIAAIEALISSCGGYIQNSYVSGTGAVKSEYEYQWRSASYTVRIPAEGFASFEASLANCGSVLSSNVYIDEVTDYYYDTSAHLSSLQTQEAQLLELMNKAADLDAIIKLQEALADVRYQIESLQGTLRRLDSQISMSTVNITVREVYEPTKIQSVPKTLGQRIAQRFENTWDDIVSALKNFAVWLLGDILLIVFWCGIIAIAVVVIVKALRRRKIRCAKNKAEKAEESSK